MQELHKQPAAPPSVVRHLGWSVPKVGLSELREAVKTAFRCCEIELIESSPGEFESGPISCSVQLDSRGLPGIKWLRHQASPFEIKLAFRSVRKELERLLGQRLVGNFELDRCPSQEALNTSPTDQPDQSEQFDPSPADHPLPIGSQKRKTFEGMAEMLPGAKVLGHCVSLIDSAPVLSRSKSHIDLDHVSVFDIELSN